MRKNHSLLLLCVIFLFAGLSASAQCPPMPQGFLCINQAAGNEARNNKLELDATKAKVTVLETALIDKDKIAAEIRTTAAKNEADLREALNRTQVELALKTGQLIGAEASNVRSLAIIDVLLKSTKKKCMPFSLCLF